MFLNNQQVTEENKREIKKFLETNDKENIKIRAEINEKEMKEAIIKINKTKSWFFEKIKLTNLQPDSSRKKERRIESTKLEMKKKRLQQTMKKYK